MTRKIYDCFTFFNELELLELRLREHYAHVDYFVIAEADKTHQGNPKPFHLEENWDCYSEFHDKIIYIKVDDMPAHHDTWVLENFQRNALARGLDDAAPHDVVVVSDLDEVLRGSTFDLIRNDNQRRLWVCRQPIFWSKLNYVQVEPKGAGYNVNSMAVTKAAFTTAQDLRNQTVWAFHQLSMTHIDNDIRTIQHAGWHFSYLGNDTQARNKLESFAHAEARHLISGLDTETAIAQGRNPIEPRDPGTYAAVVVDDYFPVTVVNDPEKYAHLIVDNATLNMKDVYTSYE